MLFCVLMWFLKSIEGVLRWRSSTWSSDRINFLEMLLMIQVPLNDDILDQMTKVFSMHGLGRLVVEIEFGLHHVQVYVRVYHENLIPFYVSRVLVGLMNLDPLLCLRPINQVLSSSMNWTALMIVSTCFGIIFYVDLIGYINDISLLLRRSIVHSNIGWWLRLLSTTTTVDVYLEPSNRLVPHPIDCTPWPSSLFLLS